MHEVDKSTAEVPVGILHNADAANDDVGRLAWLFQPFQGTEG